VLSAQTIMALSRCRWQVEIVRKRWKSGITSKIWG